MRRKIWSAVMAAALVIGVAATAQAAEAIRVGVLKFGTVNWEIDTILKNKLDAKHGVAVEVVPFAGEDASAVAFRSGDVDIIVTDWIEVARARADGDDMTFAPYSSSAGAIMVKADSLIKGLADLKGVKLAVAGGPLDKGWLLLQGLAKKDAGLDLVAANEISYGAPPLLAEKLRQGEFDAALNFWHFNARLEADGFRRIAGGGDAAKALGATGDVSTLGYVFHEGWANENRETVLNFLAASRDAKALLKSSDAEWDRLHADGVIKDEGKALQTLRDRYRDGIPERTPQEEEADAAILFGVLAGVGGETLVGKATALPPGTYWSVLTDGK
jgi:NitT/TauT family transport system substrate-binding protein